MITPTYANTSVTPICKKKKQAKTPTANAPAAHTCTAQSTFTFHSYLKQSTHKQCAAVTPNTPKPDHPRVPSYYNPHTISTPSTQHSWYLRRVSIRLAYMYTS